MLDLPDAKDYKPFETDDSRRQSSDTGTGTEETPPADENSNTQDSGSGDEGGNNTGNNGSNNTGDEGGGGSN